MKTGSTMTHIIRLEFSGLEIVVSELEIFTNQKLLISKIEIFNEKEKGRIRGLENLLHTYQAKPIRVRF